MHVEVNIGDLVRYKHMKSRVGVIIGFDYTRATYVHNYEDGTKKMVANDCIFVAWQNKTRPWFVEGKYIEVNTGGGKDDWLSAGS